MRKLRRQPKPGRAAVVVPNGTLFGDGVSARIKEELLGEFNLHTVVRLPQGVFAPYTDIPANLIFFDRTGPTGDIWYYELPLPEGRKKYSKTAPLQYEEFAACLAWWNQREGNAQAWKIDFAAIKADARTRAEPLWKQAETERQAAIELGKLLREIDLELAAANGSTRKAALEAEQRDLKRRQQAHEDAAKAAQREGDAIYWPIYNLDLKNAYAKAGLEHADPKDLVAAMRAREQDVMRLLAEIEALVSEA